MEPLEELATRLKHACRQLRLPVDVETCCLSSRSGTGELRIPSHSNGELLRAFAGLEERGEIVAERRTVELKTLDGILAGRQQRVSFIKCDVEGHELEVFQGALAILDTDRPNLLVEIEQRHARTSLHERLQFFTTRNYNGYYVNADAPLSAFDAASHQVCDDQGGLPTKYVNNFIFVPVEAPDPYVMRQRLT